MEALEKQIEADRFQGYDYVGYHAYAKRRYYELVQRKGLKFISNRNKHFYPFRR
jgi:hypothetical protein